MKAASFLGGVMRVSTDYDPMPLTSEALRNLGQPALFEFRPPPAERLRDMQRICAHFNAGIDDLQKYAGQKILPADMSINRLVCLLPERPRIRSRVYRFLLSREHSFTCVGDIIEGYRDRSIRRHGGLSNKSLSYLWRVISSFPEP